MASKFLEHFVQIADAMNSLGGTGLWDEKDGFYYDQVKTDGRIVPLRLRSMVGVLPLIAVEVLQEEKIKRLPGFYKRFQWFQRYRHDLHRHISHCASGIRDDHCLYLLAIPTRERLVRLLRYVLDENEFLSPFGLRSISKFHRDHPYVFEAGGAVHSVDYQPGESTTGLFGGNSNWRGPVWMPVNYLVIEALERYHHFFGGSFRVECPTGSGKMLTLREIACELAERLTRLFLPDKSGRRPCLRGRPALPRRSQLEGPGPFPRIFPWRNRQGAWRQPSDRLDCADHSPSGRPRPPPRPRSRNRGFACGARTIKVPALPA